MIDPITSALALLDKVPPLFIDKDGDLCRIGDGDNLVGCAAMNDEMPFGLLNPAIWYAIPELRTMVAILVVTLETERAESRVAAALDMRERAADCMAALYGKEIISALPIDPDAQVTLDKLLAEARLEGWRAGRDAAANEAALYGCSEGADEYTEGIHEGYTDAVGQIVDGIRAMPEPKEKSE